MAEKSGSVSMDVLAVGSDVWVRDDKEGWLKARVTKTDGVKVTVKTEQEDERVVDGAQCPLQNSDGRSGVEDMTQLNHLHEPGVLWNLKKRYMYDDIYTYTGNILIAVNPFQSLAHLYGSHMMEMYKGQDLGELSPHVYATAESAYRQMVSAGNSQSILVSGESGAGKTETCKLIMKYLAFLGGYAESGSLGASGSGVESKVLESNPLLEAFGNAKTVRNANSSRFGKFTEIQFDKQWRIVGAAVRTYLLERSRVVAVNDPERNYHIFYQLCAGASAQERARLHLVPPADFNYLNKSSCVDIPGTDNAAEYAATRRAMAIVGIPPVDQEAIFAVVAAVLHLGNCDFVEDPDTDGGCKLTDAVAERHLAWAAELLCVDRQGLMHALSTRTRQTPEGPIISPISYEAALSNRDSLAKTIYARLFDWLVLQVNMSIGHVADPAAVVGVLDIYGFEQFKINDFEQLCINLANEKLQQHFNQHVFKMEQAEYEAEEIDWTTIEFVDNQDVLDLIEKKPLGVLDSLDEACRFPQATGATFADKMYSNKDIMAHKRFEKPKRSNTAFIIDHYAGKVEYQVDHFLEKNKDFVVKEHQDLLAASSLPLVARALFKPDEPPPDAAPAKPGRGRAGASSYKFVSVGSQFKKQLAELMASLSTMEPHYVRCIKPNSLNVPTQFDNRLVLQQLRCGGVLEAVRISCAGYPSRRLFFDFVEHFWHLAPERVRAGDPDVEVTMHIIKQLLEGGYAHGKTKIFLKGGQMAVLEKHRTNLLNRSAVTIQKYARGHLQGGHFRRLKRTAVLLQSWARMAAAKRVVSRMRRQRAAKVVQTAWRGKSARLGYARARSAVITIQSAWRGKTGRDHAAELRAQRAATCIQRWWRGTQARTEFRAAVRKVVLVQCAWRCKVARKKLRSLKAEARSSGKLMQDKVALEARLKEMQGIVARMQEGRNSDQDKLKAATAELDTSRAELKRLRAEAAAASVAKLAAAEAAAKALKDENERLETAAATHEKSVADLRGQVEELERELADVKADDVEKDEKHKAEMNRLRAERERTKKETSGVHEDLMMRLQNACAQRDEAREQVLGLEAALEAQRLDTEAKVAAASKAAAVTTRASTPTPAPGEERFLTPEKPRDSINRVADAIKMFSPARSPSVPSPAAAAAAAAGPMVPPVPAAVAASPAAAGPYESALDRQQQEMQQKQQALVMQQRTENQDALVIAISQPLGFHRGRPVAAMLIFRCCIQWQAFELDRTTLFERIITVVGDQVEKASPLEKGAAADAGNMSLCYWLSNTVTLLLLLQKNIKPAATAGTRRAIPNGAPGSTTSFFSSARNTFNMLTGARRPPLGNTGDASIHGGGQGGFRMIAAKYPALLFKQQLDACMGKIFPLLRDNIKNAVQTPLSACIHAPRIGHGSRTRGSADGDTPPWKVLIKILQGLHEQLAANEVPLFLRRKLFLQLFSFINVQLFNQLLLRRECCSFANGEYVKQGLAQVEEWLLGMGSEVAGESWDELKYIRQAVNFLVLHAKQKKTLDDIQQNLCSALSVQQLYRISTMYWDDKFGTETVSPEVLQQMRGVMQRQQGSASHSFLLDDDSSNPFQAAEVQLSMNDKELYGEMPVPEPLQGNKAFDFLQRDLKLSAAAPQPQQ